MNTSRINLQTALKIAALLFLILLGYTMISSLQKTGQTKVVITTIQKTLRSLLTAKNRKKKFI